MIYATRENGKMTFPMAKESKFTVGTHTMMATSSMERNMGRDFTIGMINNIIKASSKKIN